MTQVSSIIESAFRELRVLDWDRNVTRLQIDEALVRLNSLVRSENGLNLGEQYIDWPLGDFNVSAQDRRNEALNVLERPPENARLVHTAINPITVYFPADPEEGTRMAITDPFNRLASVNVTLDGNGRSIEGNAVVTLTTNGLDREWIYRADLGEWLRVTDLLIDAEFPFPLEFDDYFIIGLAMRLDPRYKESISDLSLSRYREMRKKFYGRYSKTREVLSELSYIGLSNNKRRGRVGRQRLINSTQRFNRGWY